MCSSLASDPASAERFAKGGKRKHIVAFGSARSGGAPEVHLIDLTADECDKKTHLVDLIADECNKQKHVGIVVVAMDLRMQKLHLVDLIADECNKERLHLVDLTAGECNKETHLGLHATLGNAKEQFADDGKKGRTSISSPAHWTQGVLAEAHLDAFANALDAGRDAYFAARFSERQSQNNRSRARSLIKRQRRMSEEAEQPIEPGATLHDMQEWERRVMHGDPQLYPSDQYHRSLEFWNFFQKSWTHLDKKKMHLDKNKMQPWISYVELFQPLAELQQFLTRGWAKDAFNEVGFIEQTMRECWKKVRKCGKMLRPLNN